MPQLPVPRHLQALAVEASMEDDFLILRLRCPCGCGRFRTERSCLSAAETAAIADWHEKYGRATKGYFIRFRRNENGERVQMRKRGLFGRWEPLEPHLPPAPCFIGVHEVRGTCGACGRVHILFDSRLHGDEACRGAFPPEAMTWQHGWEEIPVPEGTEELRAGAWFCTAEEDVAKVFPGQPDWTNTFADFVLSAVDAQGCKTGLFCWLEEG